MTKLTIQQVFGANATQDATTITIVKSDLTSTGLTASANNTAESLVVALLEKWDDSLNETAQESNPDIVVTIADSGFPQIVTRNNSQYRQVTYNVNMQKLDTSAAVPDPDDY